MNTEPALRLLACALLAMPLGACGTYHKVPFVDAAVNVRTFWGYERTVTVRNDYGSHSDTMHATDDVFRSNIYLTRSKQLIVIEKGGESVFFSIPDNGPPIALQGKRYSERDSRSEDWLYVGVIIGDVFRSANEERECIPLYGEGHSPYRKAFHDKGCS